MFDFADSSARELTFTDDGLIAPGDSNGLLTREMLENLYQDDAELVRYGEPTYYIPVDELQDEAALAAFDRLDDEDDSDGYTYESDGEDDRYAAMAAAIDFNAPGEHITDEDDCDADEHDDIVERFDARLDREKIRFATQKYNNSDHGRRGTGDWRRSRQAVSTHDVGARLLAQAVWREEQFLRAFEQGEFDAETALELALQAEAAEREWEAQVAHAQELEQAMYWLLGIESAPTDDIAAYLRWVRTINTTYALEHGLPKSGFDWDRDAHQNGECTWECAHCLEEAREAQERELLHAHDHGQCGHCRYCELEEMGKRAIVAEWNDLYVEETYGFDHETVDDERQHVRKLAAQRSLVSQSRKDRARQGRERSFRGLLWQRHKSTHKETVPAVVKYVPVVYEDVFTA